MTVLVAFAALNLGAVVGGLVLGLVAARLRSRWMLAAVWASVALCGLLASLPSPEVSSLALLSIVGASLGAGGQALSIALANRLQLGRGLEATTVGLMAGTGRIGQFGAL